MNDAERGAVTVEAAIALSALTLVVLAALGGLAAVTAAARCTDAARELVRLAARGDVDRARSAAATIAPGGAVLELVMVDDEVRGTVTATPVDLLPVSVSASALALREPGSLVQDASARSGSTSARSRSTSARVGSTSARVRSTATRSGSTATRSGSTAGQSEAARATGTADPARRAS